MNIEYQFEEGERVKVDSGDGQILGTVIARFSGRGLASYVVETDKEYWSEVHGETASRFVWAELFVHKLFVRENVEKPRDARIRRYETD